VVTIPNYNKPTQKGILQHYQFINDNLKKNVPIMVYNIPSRTGVNLEPSTLSEIVKTCSNVCAIKESSGNHTQVLDILSSIDINVLAGDDFNTLSTIVCGGKGVVSVLSNICPAQVHQLYINSTTNIEKAKQIQLMNHNLTKLLFRETNPIPIKRLLKDDGIIKSDELRLPMTQLTDDDLIKQLDYQYKILKMTSKN